MWSDWQKHCSLSLFVAASRLEWSTVLHTHDIYDVSWPTWEPGPELHASAAVSISPQCMHSSSKIPCNVPGSLASAIRLVGWQKHCSLSLSGWSISSHEMMHTQSSANNFHRCFNFHRRFNFHRCFNRYFYVPERLKIGCRVWVFVQQKIAAHVSIPEHLKTGVAPKCLTNCVTFWQLIVWAFRHKPLLHITAWHYWTVCIGDT